MRRHDGRTQVVLGGVAAVLLTGLSMVAVTAARGGSLTSPDASSCPVPTLPGTVLTLTETNMGGPMMGAATMVGAGAMRLSADHPTVAAGVVSFLVTNRGSTTHEALVLPLPGSQLAGTRPTGGDAKVDEAGSLAEASLTCGAGPGQGILPGASGWVTATLTPGRYELVCNFPGHYAAGMYTQLTVT